MGDNILVALTLVVLSQTIDDTDIKIAPETCFNSSGGSTVTLLSGADAVMGDDEGILNLFDGTRFDIALRRLL